MKEIYRKLDMATGIWWLFLILIFIAFPVFQIHEATITCKESGQVITDKPLWLYILGIFVYDFVIMIFLMSIAFITMILTKLHNYFSGDEK